MKAPRVNPKVLVTGCSSGIGRATARLLRDRGWQVVPTARGEVDLDALRTEGFDPVRLDLADSASVQGAADTALRLMDGAPGALVNNAGMGQPGALEDLDRDALRRQFEVNVFGMQELTNRFIPLFRAAGAGRVVNVSSVLGRIVLPSMGAYCASKFAMEALSHTLRIELRGSGVTVSLVEPGPIETAFSENALAAARRCLDPDRSVFGSRYRAQLDEATGGSRENDRFRKPPEAVARVILHALASERPRRRYRVTLPAHLGAFLSRCAPDGLLDWLLWQRLRARHGDAKSESTPL